MKIAMLTPYFFPHTGGTEKYVKDISLGLVELGHEVTIFACNVPKAANAPVAEDLEGVKIKRIPAVDVLYLPISKAFDLKNLEGFDLIHVHCPPFGFVRTVAGKVKVPVVVTYHCDTTVSERLFGVPVPGFVPAVVEGSTNAYARRLLPKVDAIISTSQAYASTSPVLKDFKPYIIPIGIHFERLDEVKNKIGITEESRRKSQVLFLGRLAANKGVNYLIQAMPKVLAKFSDAHFVITGEGEEKKALVKLIKKLGVEKQVTFYGKISFEILVHLYATSTVFVLPSINRLEAFGIVQLEAMACSTPVICSNIPGPNSVMEKGKSGLIVEPKDPDGLAEAIVKILANPQMSKEMGQRGRWLIENKYNWNIIIRQIENIYKGLLSK